MARHELAVNFLHYAILTERMCIWVQISTICSVQGEAGIDRPGRERLARYRERVLVFVIYEDTDLYMGII